MPLMDSPAGARFACCYSTAGGRHDRISAETNNPKWRPLMQTGTTLSQFIHQHLQQLQPPALGSVLGDLASACKAIAEAVSQGQLAGVRGSVDSQNPHGETQKKLDLIADDLLLRHCGRSGLVAAIASEELTTLRRPERAHTDSPFLLLYDPLDGSSNVDVDGAMGTIFSLLPAVPGRPAEEADLLQAGERQLCAGYVLYGPATRLVLTVGQGTHSFTLDRRIGEFILTAPEMSLNHEHHEFAINASYRRFWNPPVRRYIDACLAGTSGPFGHDYGMRWVGAMVADVHRILSRGGIFLYPDDTRPKNRDGRLRLLYEANPMSLLIEQAGGLASTGHQRILALQPTALHQRCPVILGSRREVERVLQEYARAG